MSLSRVTECASRNIDQIGLSNLTTEFYGIKVIIDASVTSIVFNPSYLFTLVMLGLYLTAELSGYVPLDL